MSRKVSMQDNPKPLPDGSRVEIGDNYVRYSHKMPPRQP